MSVVSVRAPVEAYMYGLWIRLYVQTGQSSGNCVSGEKLFIRTLVLPC